MNRTCIHCGHLIDDHIDNTKPIRTCKWDTCICHQYDDEELFFYVGEFEGNLDDHKAEMEAKE